MLTNTFINTIYSSMSKEGAPKGAKKTAEEVIKEGQLVDRIGELCTLMHSDHTVLPELLRLVKEAEALNIPLVVTSKDIETVMK